MAQTTSVLWSVDQGLGEEEQSQARLNIGAASSISINTLKSALNRLSNTVQDISYKVAVNDREITEIKSKLAPHIGNGTVAYNATGDNLICELSACKVYASISSENYCQLKVIADNTNSEESITLALASAVITMIPILIVYLFAQSKIIEGVANTGIKR